MYFKKYSTKEASEAEIQTVDHSQQTGLSDQSEQSRLSTGWVF